MYNQMFDQLKISLTVLWPLNYIVYYLKETAYLSETNEWPTFLTRLMDDLSNGLLARSNLRDQGSG
jgi:hypothetical protein